MFDFKKVRTIDDFPTPGIKFYDITTLMNDAEEFDKAIQDMVAIAKEFRPDALIALESRGFFFGPIIAHDLHIPFVPIRKKGKLPAATFSQTYDLEYGTDIIEIHQDAVKEGQRLLLVDDILATGGTMSAAVKLVEHFKPAAVSALFLMELMALKGRDRIQGVTVNSIVQL
ncbi:MAG: adenine phosphoribosyltransferase [Bacteroidales bacterium]|nr:adenine phosphoribosyltransferase [Bacteroidales bacterium]